MTGPAFQLAASGDGVLAVRGTLSFDTAHAALLALRERVAAGGARVLDLGGVSRSDSAGLACVLAVLADARRQGRALAVRHLPDGMRALASVCAVEPMLDVAEAAAD